MKRLGIITHYYNSTNYGGVLQAYALCHFLNEEGCEAEQICYDSRNNKLKKQSFKEVMANVIFKMFYENKWKKRKQSFKVFRDKVPHSKKVYNLETIEQCVNDYDIFVTGSDQVWNLKSYHPAYFLEFVPSNKCKMSYAASACTSHLDEEQQGFFCKKLHDFSGISVREKDTVTLLQPLVQQNIHWSVDPVFLLDKIKWDKLCSKRVINTKYLFCYFLGNDSIARKVAKQYAKKKKLKIVTISYINQRISKDMYKDYFLGDIHLIDVSPEDFLSLIRYADTVFTDSFHAVAFSTIYQKNFFVFERMDAVGMDSRIHSLMDIIDCNERFCINSNKNIDHILNCEPIDYESSMIPLEALKQKSYIYLKNSIGDCNEN